MNSNLSTAPYYDDYDESKNFTQVLFRPDRAVQARELTQSQTILQKQIARFGDNIFKQGSVVSGCHVNPIDTLPYVKINDLATDGSRVSVSDFNQLYVKNGLNANTNAVILSTSVGYENSAPDLNTLFVRYVTSGDDGQSPTFNAGDTLTIYNPLYQIESVEIDNGSSGFSNNDTISFIPAVYVTNATGGNTFTSGIYIGDSLSNGVGANVVIQAVTFINGTTAVALKPTTNDLNTANTAAWTIVPGVYTDTTTGQNIVVANVVGSGAAGRVVTNPNGIISDIAITSPGSGYSLAPTAVVVSSSATSTQMSQVLVTAHNYVKQVTVAQSLYSPIGNGFGVTIDEGVIYQQQNFTRTDKQFVVVSKYSTTPSDIVVGFESTADIVTYLDDPSLVDNAQGFSNFNAPGADRVRVTASAVVIPSSEAASRTDFVSLIEFSEGQPFKTTDTSTYSLIENAIALRTYEQAGNFVIDPFLVNTKSVAIANEPTSVNVVVDPGTGYIDGYRISTDYNFVTPINKATTTKIVSSTTTNVDYGNYVVCDQLIGSVATIIDSVVTLQSGRLVVGIGGDPAAVGTAIGSARIKGVKTVSVGGIVKYNVYLYDILLNGGITFANVLSLYNASYVFNIDATVGSIITNASSSRSIFNLPANAVKHVSNVSYTYQKTNWGTVTANTTGYVTLTVSSPELFPVAGALSADQLRQVIISPSANVISANTLTGTITTTAASNTITGSATTFNTVTLGSYISIGNSTSNSITQVVAVTNAISAIVSPAPTVAYAGVSARPAFPKGMAIPLASANVSIDRTTLTANIGYSIPSTNVTIVAPVSTTPTVASKAVTRSAGVRLTLSSNAGGAVGPWCLGHSDIIRLRGVYLGSNTTFTEVSTGVSNITNDYYIDSNHTPDSSGLGYLYQKVKPITAISTSSQLLVVFDVVKSSATEVRTVDSYPIADGVELASLTASVNTVELPEINVGSQYFDTRDALDFRPFFANTVALQTNHAIAPVNPTEPVYSARYAATTRFPAPDTTVSSTIEYYVGRNDLIVATANAEIKVITGQAGTNLFPQQPNQSIVINKLVVPPYPSLPAAYSNEMAKIVDTKIANERYSNQRMGRYTLQTTFTATDISNQQPKRYQMTDIGSIDRRVSAVEYSLSLSLAETQTSNRNIPSANDPTDDRFKFGFFVDSFTDDSRSDITNPQYTATVVNNVAGPRTVEYVVSLTANGAPTASNGVVTLPYQSDVLISQLTTTDGPVIVPPVVVVPVDPVIVPGQPPVIIPPVAPPLTTITANVVTQSLETYAAPEQAYRVSDSNGFFYEDRTFVLSSIDGPANVYLNAVHNTDALEVFQSTDPNFIPSAATLIKNTNSVVDLTSAEFAQYGSLAYSTNGAPVDPNNHQVALDFGEGCVGYHIIQLGSRGSGAGLRPAFTGPGKISFMHNAAAGMYYVIRITKYGGYSSRKNAFGRYRMIFVYPKDHTSTITIPGVPSSIDYSGQFTSILPAVFNSGSFTDATSQTFYIPAQTFNITINGLRPSSQHTFMFDGVDNTLNCTPVGGIIGQGLTTDASGSLAFTFYYNAVTPTTDFELTNAIANASATAKAMSVYDGYKSFAYGTIRVKPYVSNAYNGGGAFIGSYLDSISDTVNPILLAKFQYQNELV